MVDQIALRVPSVGKTVIVGAANDPERLIGRPNAYTSKTEFVDTRLAQRPNSLTGVRTGGAVEIFADESSAIVRRDFLQNVRSAVPVDREYDYLAGSILLRLSPDMTTDQAAEYEEALHDVSAR